jgi:hypothetical protein
MKLIWGGWGAAKRMGGLRFRIVTRLGRPQSLISTGAKNLAGIPLSSNKSWAFTTGK